MKAAGVNVPLMGGDGIYDPKFIKLAGADQQRRPRHLGRRPDGQLDAGKKFIADYKAAGYEEPYAAYGGYSYDAAKAIIQAVKTSLASAADAKSADARATIDAVGKVSFDGVTGKVAFDEYGDTTNKLLTVYQVDGGKWVAAKTDTFK